jgi:hypothetical protein
VVSTAVLSVYEDGAQNRQNSEHSSQTHVIMVWTMAAVRGGVWRAVTPAVAVIAMAPRYLSSSQVKGIQHSEARDIDRIPRTTFTCS